MSNWVQLGQDINGISEGEQTGRSLSISGDGTTLAIGAPFSSNSIGQVRVYRIPNSNWEQIGDSINGTQQNEILGISVSLSKNGNVLAIGSAGFDTSTGKVTIYEFNGTNWVQLGNDIDGDNINDEFGYSVSLSDNGNIVGIGTTSGLPKIYEFINLNWTQKGSDLDNTGFSVSLSGNGNIFAIGDKDVNSETGQVKIYNYNGIEWLLLGSELSGDNENESFGRSVSISSNGIYLVIGAPGDFTNRKGYFKVFEFINNNWQQIGNNVIGGFDFFGYAVSITNNGKSVGVGANNASPNGLRSGQTSIYNYNGINWNKNVSFDGKEANDGNGYAVSLSNDGKIFAFGAPFSNVNFSSSGQARVFKLKESKPVRPKKKRKLRTFIKYGKSCGIVYFVTCLQSGLYRIVKKTRNNAGKLVTQEVRTLPTYNVAF